MPEDQLQEVKIDKLVHGGQGIGTMADGKKALVWNVLPGEFVRFSARKSKSSFVEGIATEILQPSPERIKPKDELYLSTSPWQMMKYDAENKHKQAILGETLQRGGILLETDVDFVAPDTHWHYRNKMEYSFWGDEEGLYLALYNRGTHRKQKVSGSSIARSEIDQTASSILKVLQDEKVRAGSLKSLVVRCSQAGQTACSLYVKDEDFDHTIFSGPLDCQGIVVIYSNPKSPASVFTRQLGLYGSVILEDELMAKKFSYGVTSFFQVHLEIYSKALKLISDEIGDEKVIDMYGGVGSIGLSTAKNDLLIIESEKENTEFAEKNANKNDRSGTTEIITATAESALDRIEKNSTVIVDPPRAGLHQRLINKLTEVLPTKIVYLSCNPSTLARDLELLQNDYTVRSVGGLNFFPRTPHIEALAILEKK